MTAVLAGLGVAVAVVLLLMRNSPAEIGLRPFGAKEDAIPTAGPQTLGQLFLTPVTVLRDAVGNRAFWVLFGTFFICGASTNGLIQTHFISMCGDYGTAPVSMWLCFLWLAASSAFVRCTRFVSRSKSQVPPKTQELWNPSTPARLNSACRSTSKAQRQCGILWPRRIGAGAP